MAARQVGLDSYLILRTKTHPENLDLTGISWQYDHFLCAIFIYCYYVPMIGNLLLSRMVGSRILTVPPGDDISVMYSHYFQKQISNSSLRICNSD